MFQTGSLAADDIFMFPLRLYANRFLFACLWFYRKIYMKFSDLRICSVVSLSELAYIYGDPIRIIITSYGLSIEHLDFVLFMLLSFFDHISIIVL
jgi:hypothetical protein